MNLFNLFAKISLDDKDFEKGVNNAEKKGKGLSNTFSGIGKSIGTLASATVKAVGVASASVTALAGLSIKQYAEYEQLVGGVETLFKESADEVMKYSEVAYKTAGVSANTYMETITSFSASLLQGLGGDTKKASELGNQAVIAMADNANKMGTSMDSIIATYQSLSRGNFAMLDNLKLGYGGTKEELQRLLDKAGELNGTVYEMGNFADVIVAIQTIQDELGITGTTALEAEKTISGSFNAMKSSWTNLLTGFADEDADFDKLVGNLVETVGTFGDNILPRIKIAFEGIGIFLSEFAWQIPDLLSGIIPTVIETGGDVVLGLIKGISGLLPEIGKTAVEIIKSLSTGIKETLPSIIEEGISVVGSLIEGIVEVLPTLLEAGILAILELGKGISESLPNLIPVIVDLMVSLCDIIIENLPMILDVAIDIIMALVDGLITALPTLIAEVPRIINTFSEKIYDMLPTIIKAGIDLIIALIKGLIDAIPTLVENIPEIIQAIVNVFTLYNWWNLGKNLIAGIGEGIKGMKGNVVQWAKDVANNVINGIKGLFTGNAGSIGKNFISNISSGLSSMKGSIVDTIRNIGSSVISKVKSIFNWDTASSIGKNLIQGIWAGISNMTGWIMDKIGGFASNVVSGIKGFFGIHSPSRVLRDEVGVFMAQGIGVGFEEEMENVNADIQNSLTADYDIPTADKPTDKTDIMISLLQQLVAKDNKIEIDGRETMRVLSKYQDELEVYNSRSPEFTF